jgi:hypothetical protein
MRTTAFEEYPHETALRLKKEAASDLYDALANAPIIGKSESAIAFRVRQDKWLDGMASPALAIAEGRP